MKARLLRALPVTIVVAAIAAGIAMVSIDEWRVGSAILAGAAGLGAVMRLVLPTTAVGVLAVRSRAFDVTVFVLLAVLFAGIALVTVTPHA